MKQEGDLDGDQQEEREEREEKHLLQPGHPADWQGGQRNIGGCQIERNIGCCQTERNIW